MATEKTVITHEPEPSGGRQRQKTRNDEQQQQQQHTEQNTQTKQRKQLTNKEAEKVGMTFILTVSAAILVAAVVYATRKSAITDGTDQFKWWQKGTIYQIYPRSFQDSNNDGIGDLKGITSRLPYFNKLGIQTLWISPFFTSPQADFGYDISNFTDIDPQYGTMADFDNFMKECRKLGLRVLLDFVPNHSSNKHPWFLESKSSKTNSKRDWYIWADGVVGADGKLHPPNNWISIFGGSAWEYDNTTNQFYYHEFLVDQPDLNYRNPEVLKAMQDVLAFWLDKGVDGFRVDAFAFVHEVTDLTKDEPPNTHPHIPFPYDRLLHIYTYNLPEAHDVAHAFRNVLDRYEDKFMIGEIYLPMAELLEYYGKPDKPEFHMPFNFLLLELFRTPGGFNAHNVSTLVNTYIASLPEGHKHDGNQVYSNHDNPRVISQLREDMDAARAAMLLLLTLPGAPTIYYGDEIGMHDVPVAVCSDPAADQCRDPERTPMQWTSEVPNAGFTGKHVTPWLPVANDSHSNNVETQMKDPKSFLNMFINLMKLRNAEPALHIGDYIQLNSTSTEVYAFGRQYGSNTFYIICNLHNSTETTTITGGASSGHLIMEVQNRLKAGSKVHLKNLKLHPWESLIIKVD